MAKRRRASLSLLLAARLQAHASLDNKPGRWSRYAMLYSKVRWRGARVAKGGRL